MTDATNDIQAEAVVDGGSITLILGDRELTLDVKEVTSVLRVLLPARKEAYENARSDREADRAAAKAEADAKKAERLAERARKLEERRAKLEAELAKLSA